MKFFSTLILGRLGRTSTGQALNRIVRMHGQLGVYLFGSLNSHRNHDEQAGAANSQILRSHKILNKQGQNGDNAQKQSAGKINAIHGLA